MIVSDASENESGADVSSIAVLRERLEAQEALVETLRARKRSNESLMAEVREALRCMQSILPVEEDDEAAAVPKAESCGSSEGHGGATDAPDGDTASNDAAEAPPTSPPAASSSLREDPARESAGTALEREEVSAPAASPHRFDGWALLDRLTFPPPVRDQTGETPEWLRETPAASSSETYSDDFEED